MPRVTRFYQTIVGASAVQIVPFSQERSGLLIRNYSGAEVFLSSDGVDVTTKGFPVAAGEFFGLLKSDGDAPELQIYAQTALGTADIRIVESFG